jgi:hypothetical protein
LPLRASAKYLSASKYGLKKVFMSFDNRSYFIRSRIEPRLGIHLVILEQFCALCPIGTMSEEINYAKSSLISWPTVPYL